ncbi:hypothetical protein BH160DRAFT_4479 [Burkholderia sp. H160]|nr:hypothetical protein BH160DRAFT_4479 [Burkholderia sp. H160]
MSLFGRYEIGHRLILEILTVLEALTFLEILTILEVLTNLEQFIYPRRF